MVGCGHNVLCSPCCQAMEVHEAARGSMDPSKLSRLLCPICRGFEVDGTPH